jgi:imidazolonepropionase-like amidohydrolase
MAALATIAVAAAATAQQSAAQPAAPSDQEEVHAFVGARLIPISGPEIDDGAVVISGGTIAAVGPRAEVEIPAGAEVHDLAGRVVMPGLVDTHSHIGGGSGGDRSAPIQPEVRILDSIDVRNSGLQRAQAGGITTVNVLPAPGT